MTILSNLMSDRKRLSWSVFRSAITVVVAWVMGGLGLGIIWAIVVGVGKFGLIFALLSFAHGTGSGLLQSFWLIISKRESITVVEGIKFGLVASVLGLFCLVFFGWSLGLGGTMILVVCSAINSILLASMAEMMRPEIKCVEPEQER